MAWSDSLQDARFRGIVFDVLKVDDEIARATAEHAYPYADGAEIEDLGRAARRITLDAVFFGDHYEALLENFLKALHEPGAGELIHPVFGSLTVQLASSRVHHEADSVDQATVTLEFIETAAARGFFVREVAAQKVARIGSCGAPALAASAAAMGDTVDRLRSASPLAALNDLRQSMTGPILAGLATVRAVASGLDVLAFPRAWAGDVSAIVDGMLDLRDFTTAPLADLAAIRRTLSLFDVFTHRDVTVGPIRAGVTPTEPQAVAATRAHLATATALGEANAAAAVLGAEAETPTLSPPEIEAIINVARTALDTRIEDVRALYSLEVARAITEPLKDAALALQEAARAIIEARPPLLRRTVDAPGNLRLLAHRWYGDHTRAPELWRLNSALRAPNTLRAGDTVNGYAR